MSDALNPTTLKTQFDRDGYVVIPNMIDLEDCAQLLNFILNSIRSTEGDFILSPGFRIHCPLELNALTYQAINYITQPMYPVLDQFLMGSQRLVELSSITVFPFAEGQDLHSDERNEGKYLVSVFVNLAPTHANAGALYIIPGSHKTYHDAHTASEAIPVELPAGSVVFMNSKTIHAGSANQTLDHIRPVFYFSFGEPDLDGPTYSIRPDVAAKHMHLMDFQPYQPEWMPQLAEGYQLLRSVGSDTNLYVLKDDHIVQTLSVSANLAEALSLVAQPEVEKDLHQISQQMGLSSEEAQQLESHCYQLKEAMVLH